MAAALEKRLAARSGPVQPREDCRPRGEQRSAPRGESGLRFNFTCGRLRIKAMRPISLLENQSMPSNVEPAFKKTMLKQALARNLFEIA